MASALTLKTGSTTCSISDLSGSTACEGAYDGNDSNQSLNGIFGLDNWSEIAKVDASSGTSGVLTTTAASGAETGTWTVSAGGYSAFGTIMAVLKGSDSFSAYLLGASDTAATSGTWSTASLINGQVKPGKPTKFGPGLSHFTLYGTGTPPTTVVPLPAGGVLLLTGLVGFGIARRRKAA